MRTTRNFALLALCLSIAASLPAANLKAMVHALNGVYDGQTVTLRRFSSGSSLHYASNGDFVKGGKVGSWTLDAYVQIAKIQMNQKQLCIHGNRLDFMYDQSIKDLRPYRGPAVSIEITIDPMSANLTSLQSALSKVFVSDRVAMANLAPDYWRQYLLRTPSYKKTPASADQTLALPKPASARDITPPRPIHTPDPPYTPEGRAAGLHGDVILRVVVGIDGAVKSVTILRPLGLGLDESAVRTIEGWKFIPAKRDGRPIAFQAVIDVTFHLFR